MIDCKHGQNVRSEIQVIWITCLVIHADRKDGVEFNLLLSIFVPNRLLLNDYSKNIVHFFDWSRIELLSVTVHAARHFQTSAKTTYVIGRRNLHGKSNSFFIVIKDLNRTLHVILGDGLFEKKTGQLKFGFVLAWGCPQCSLCLFVL